MNRISLLVLVTASIVGSTVSMQRGQMGNPSLLDKVSGSEDGWSYKKRTYFFGAPVGRSGGHMLTNRYELKEYTGLDRHSAARYRNNTTVEAKKLLTRGPLHQSGWFINKKTYFTAENRGQNLVFNEEYMPSQTTCITAGLALLGGAMHLWSKKK